MWEQSVCPAKLETFARGNKEIWLKQANQPLRKEKSGRGRNKEKIVQQM